MSNVFVGRKAQQEAFIRWVETDARPGEVKRAALLVGSRGIGKSSLLRQFEQLCLHHAPATWFVQHVTVNANETPSAFLERVLRELYGLFKRKYVAQGPKDHHLLKKLLSASTAFLPGGAPIGNLLKALISPEDTRPGYERFLDYTSAINNVLKHDERLVMLIDPVRVMHHAQAEEWFSVVGQLPSNVRIVIAQRPTDPIVSEPEWRRHFRSITGSEDLEDLSEDDVTELYTIAAAQEPLLGAAAGWTASVRDRIPQAAFHKYGGHPFAHNAVIILLSQLPMGGDPLAALDRYPPKLAEELVDPLYEALRRQGHPRRALLLLLQVFRGPVPKSTWAHASQLDASELDSHLASPEFSQYLKELTNPLFGTMYTLFHSIFADRLERVLVEEPNLRDGLARQALDALPAHRKEVIVDGESVVTDFDLIVAPILASRLANSRSFIAIVLTISKRKEALGLLDWAIADHMLGFVREVIVRPISCNVE